MATTERTLIKQVELVLDDNKPSRLVAERIVETSRDGAVIATHFHRDEFPADSDEARGILGDTLAKAILDRDAAIAESEWLRQQIATLQAGGPSQ
jgi:hypothetical protein